jgi:hypothetical protein
VRGRTKSGLFFLSILKKTVAIRLGEEKVCEAAVLLGFGFVFAQSQAAAGMFLRSSLAKTPKSLAAERPQFFFKRSRCAHFLSFCVCSIFNLRFIEN